MVVGRAVVLAVAVWPCLGVLSQSVTSCGGAADHMQNLKVKLSPDPVQKGKPLTVDVSGDLDEDIAAGAVNVGLSIVALGVIHSNVKQVIPFSQTPGLPKGPFKLSIGPSMIPNLPGSVVVQGQVHVVDGKGEAVFCLDLNIHVGGSMADNSTQEELRVEKRPRATAPSVNTVASCSKVTDHLKGAIISSSGGVMSIKGTLDESLSKLSIDLDVIFKVLFVSIPLKSKIPLSISPPFPQGVFGLTMGPVSGTISPDPHAHVKGTAVLNDGNAEEVACLNLDVISEDTAAKVATNPAVLVSMAASEGTGAPVSDVDVLNETSGLGSGCFKYKECSPDPKSCCSGYAVDDEKHGFDCSYWGWVCWKKKPSSPPPV